MTNHLRSILLGALAAALPHAAMAQTTAPAPTDADRESLVSAIREKLDDPRFFNAHWGIRIVSLQNGAVWFEQNAERLFIPASNQKIPTTAAALLTLGPDWRYPTVVATDGELRGDTLDGNLIVFGYGDPTIYERFYDDSKDLFRQWATVLRTRGITTITGDIVGDDNAWDDEHTGNGWPYDELTPWYYAEYGALTFNENYVDIDFVAPDTPDGDVTLVPNVESSYYTLINNVEAVAEGSNSISMYRPIGSNEIRLSGTVVAGSDPFERTPTITNPTQWYVHVLTEVLEEEGISVEGGPVDCDDIEGWEKTPDDVTVLIEHESAPLSEILQGLMKRSQNMYAENMVHTLGWHRDGRGTFRGGRAQVQMALEEIGIDPDHYNFSDGSGLSRYNYISPLIITTIYEELWKREDTREFWWEMQAIAGEDGTLRRRMDGTAAEGKVRGKTGLVYAVRTLSGYAETGAGELLAFSFMCNAHQRSSSEVDGIYDDILVMLAEHGADSE